MRTYQQALDHYNSITKPPRSKHWNGRGEGALDNGKPLRRTAEVHMGIHKNKDNVIYYRLYNTNVASFYPPDENGIERRTFKYVATQTTTAFMFSYNLHFYNVTMDDGTEASVPYTQNGNWGENNNLTADLYFNTDNQVIRHLSSHKDVYTMVSNDEDKAKRKELREKVEHLITLALFKLPQLKEDVTIEEQWGMPFGTSYRNTPRAVDALKQYVSRNNVDINNQEFVSLFMDSLQSFFNLYASKSCYDAELFKWTSFWHLQNIEEREEAMKKHKLEQQEQRFAKVAELTAEGFKKSLTNMLLSASNIKTGSVKKPWGQFMPKLPRTFIG